MNKNRLALILAAAVSAMGCAKEVPAYTPNRALVGKLGEAGAKERLKKLISQAAAPQVDGKSVEIEGNYYYYQAIDMAMFGRGFMSMKVFYDKVTRIEVWDDDGRYYCKLIGIDEDGDEKRLDQLRWASGEEAREFADLLGSFQAHLKAPKEPKPKEPKQSADRR